MSKSKKKRLKRVKKPQQQQANQAIETAQEQVQVAQKSGNYGTLLTYVGLAAIVIFAIFLRAENFSVWKKNKKDLYKTATLLRRCQNLT